MSFGGMVHTQFSIFKLCEYFVFAIKTKYLTRNNSDNIADIDDIDKSSITFTDN